MHRSKRYESLGTGSSQDSLPQASKPTQEYDDHAILLTQSLDQYDQEQKKGNKRWPLVMLSLLIVIVLSSSGGITLAVILMVPPFNRLPEASLARDVILFASSLGFLYTALHVRGARKGYVRHQQGPLHIHGNVTHAGAVIVARLAICVWLGALVASAVLTAKTANPFAGFFGAVPILDLVICAGALPSFILVSATMEKSSTPFATTGLTSKPGLNRKRLAALADDSLEADMSISRRATVHKLHKNSCQSPFSLGSNFDAQSTRAAIESPAPAPLTRPVFGYRNLWSGQQTSAKVVKPPQPTYSPGTWRTEWNGVADEVGIPRIHPNSSNSGSSSYYHDDQSMGPASTYYQQSEREPRHFDDTRSSSSCYSSSTITTECTSPSSSSSSLPSESNCLLSSPRKAKHQTTTTTNPIQQPRKAAAKSSKPTDKNHRPRRSNLSTVRYASRPNIAVRQPAQQPKPDQTTTYDEDEDDQPSPATTTVSGILEAAAAAAVLASASKAEALTASRTAPTTTTPTTTTTTPPNPNSKPTSEETPVVVVESDDASSYTSAITTSSSSSSSSSLPTSPVHSRPTIADSRRTKSGGPLSSHPVYTISSAAEKKTRRSRRKMMTMDDEGKEKEKKKKKKSQHSKQQQQDSSFSEERGIVVDAKDWEEERKKRESVMSTATTITSTNNFSRPLGTGVYGYDAGSSSSSSSSRPGTGYSFEKEEEEGKKKKKGDSGVGVGVAGGIAVNY